MLQRDACCRYERLGGLMHSIESDHKIFILRRSTKAFISDIPRNRRTRAAANPNPNPDLCSLDSHARTRRARQGTASQDPKTCWATEHLRIGRSTLFASRQRLAPTARVSRSDGFTTIRATNLTDCDRRGSLFRTIQNGRLDFSVPCI